MRAAMVVAVLLLAAPARGQGEGRDTASPIGRVSASVTVGLGIPSGQVFQDVYGSRTVPLGAQVDWRIGGAGFGVFGGVRWVSRAGEAILEGSGRRVGERVEFGMTSWRLGPSWSVLRGAWGLTLAAGLAYNRYHEEWESAGLRPEDSGMGAVLQAGVERRLGGRFSALLRVEHGRFEAEAPHDTGLGGVTLGSTDLAAGVAVRF